MQRFLHIWLVLLVYMAGCDGPKPNPNAAAPGENKTAAPLRVLVVDDPEMAAAIREQWSTRSTGQELVVDTAAADDLKTAQRLSADVLVFPTPMLGELAEGELIQPLTDRLSQSDKAEIQRSSLNPQDWFANVRQGEASWGRKLYAAPLGCPRLVLFYRRDLFEKLKLEPPATWDAYAAAVKALSDRDSLGDLAPAAGHPWHATLEPLGGDWAGITLLARAAASVQAEGQMYTLFNGDDVAARIAAEPYVRALDQLAEANSAGGNPSPALTPAEVWQAMLRGECGMALTWPAAAGRSVKEPAAPLACAELPGSGDAFSFKAGSWSKREGDGRAVLLASEGRLAAVTREARRSKEAFELVAWLSGSEATVAISAASEHTTFFAHSQSGQAAAWTGPLTAPVLQQYVEVVEKCGQRAAALPVLRLPGSDVYRTALADAVRERLAGKLSSADALATAAKAWDAETARRGVSQQKRAYQRSLGNDY
jgi:ABC-type glycerol-3-phosphate transport system substrate-binding protein